MKTVILIIGTIGSGKDTAAKYLRTKLDWPRFSISDPLKSEAKKRGLAINRENLVELGKLVKAERGDGYLAELVGQKITGNAIVTGIRQFGQIEYFKRHFKVVLVAVDAPVEERFKRTKNSRLVGEANSLAEFIDSEKKENSGSQPQRVFAIMRQADYRIDNIGTIKEFHIKLDELIALIRS